MLNSYSNPSVQDELESFFHVILYIAIILLPHNCSDSALSRLLHDFFEDSIPHRSGQHMCPDVRTYAMGSGVIRVTAYMCEADRALSPRGALTFLCPKASNHPTSTVETPQVPRPPHTDERFSRSQRVMHPLNNIVDELLRWFCAHYTPKPSPRPVAQSRDMTLPTPPDVLEIMETLARLEARKKRLRAKQVALGLAPVVAEPEPEPEPKSTIDYDAISAREDAEAAARWERMRELRAKLESHDAMVALLADTLVEKVWPAADRIGRNLECLRFE